MTRTSHSEKRRAASRGQPRLARVHRLTLCASALLLPLLATIPAWAGDPPQDANSGVTVIKAGRIHTIVDDPIDNGFIIIRGGEIDAVGREVRVPDGAEVIDLSAAVVTPGLIDACCVVHSEIPQAATRRVYGEKEYSFWEAVAAIETEDPDAPSISDDRPPTGVNDTEFPRGSVAAIAALAPRRRLVAWADQASEVTPHRRVIDSVDLLSNDFARLMKAGVTTVYVSPDSASVIGSRGAVVKTGGPLKQRIVESAAAVKASLGEDPRYRGQRNNLPPPYGPSPTFHTRRPTTRMGVDWVFCKAFHDARRAREGLALHGADTPPPEAIPILQQILDGQVPLRIQARMQHDIFTALRLAGEFDLDFTLEEATEAYRCLPQLKAADVPVIFGPLFMTPTGWRAYTSEVKRPRLNTPKQLEDAGIGFALTARELRDEDGLVRQGMVAVRHGLSKDQALRAITSTPAKLLGFDGKLGVIQPGARADLAAWSSEPFDATSRPVLVMIGGRVVHDDRR